MTQVASRKGGAGSTKLIKCFMKNYFYPK